MIPYNAGCAATDLTISHLIKNDSTCECNAQLTHLFIVVIMTLAVKTACDKTDDSKKMPAYSLQLHVSS